MVSPQEVARGESVKKIDGYCAQFKTEFSPSEIEPESYPIEEEIPPQVAQTSQTDFRQRAPVRDQLSSVWLLDRSEERWRNRRGGRDDCPQEPDDELDDSGDLKADPDTSSRLLSRLTNNIVSKVGEQIKSSLAESLDQATDKIEDKLELRAREKYEEVEPVITRVARALLFKGCLLFVALTIFSLLIVGTVKRGLVWCKRKSIAWLATLKIPEGNNPS